MNSDFFGMDDLEIESSSSVFGRLVLGAMLIVFALASMATTFSFFYAYAPGLGRVLHAGYAGEIAGTLGVLLFDAAGLGWTVLRSRNSDTSRQFVIATAAAVVTIALALLTSALYVILSSSFDVGLYTAAGNLSDFGNTMQVIGVATMTAGFVLNFGAIAAYVNTSASVTRAVQETQLAALANAGRFRADQARAELVTRQTLQAILSRLPHLAATAGEEAGAGYLDQAFTRPSTAGAGGHEYGRSTPSAVKLKPPFLRPDRGEWDDYQREADRRIERVQELVYEHPNLSSDFIAKRTKVPVDVINAYRETGSTGVLIRWWGQWSKEQREKEEQHPLEPSPNGRPSSSSTPQT